MPRKMTPENRVRLQRLERSIATLPTVEQPLWRRRVRALLDGTATVRVSGGASGGWGAEDVAAVEENSGTEWDLALANALDRAYGAVSDRVSEVAKKGADAVSQFGFSLWPLAAVVAVWALARK